MKIESKFTFLFWFIVSVFIAVLGLLTFAVYKGSQILDTFLS